MDLTFYELQQLAENAYTIEDTRNDLGELVEYFKSLPYYQQSLESLIKIERKLNVETAVKHDVFFVSEDTVLEDLEDKFKNESLGFVRGKYITQLGRLVYPVKDVKGNVMGLVGWDKYEEPKYLDSKNFGYKAKQTTLYGMEELPNYYTSNKPVFLVEGVVDCLYLRQNGFQALSSLGSYLTKYCIEILKRFGSRLYVVPDMDEAGNSYVKQVMRVLPKAHIFQARNGKDIDGFRKLEDSKYEKQVLKDLNTLSTIPFIQTESFYNRR